MKQSSHFLLKFHNIPLVNLRMEFNGTYGFIFSPEAETCLKPPIKPIHLPLLIWGGMPEDLMTLLLQRAILGVEAYLPWALIATSAIIGNISENLTAKLRNPFAFGAKSAAANIYDHAPKAVHTELSLRHLDEQFYNKTVEFYRVIRNPLFHDEQIHDNDVQHIRIAFDHLARIYEWIDYWYDPEKLTEGGGMLAGIRARYPMPNK